MNAAMSWGVLFAIGVLLIVAGFQGSFGKLVAVAFVPSIIDANAAANKAQFKPITPAGS